MQINITARDPAIQVLIIDDHKLLQDGLLAMLAGLKKHLPMQPRVAESGEQALHLMETQEFGLAIVDYRLPGISGPETIRRMLRFRPALKVLALSNYADLEAIREMTEAGALGYVLKSVHPEQLLAALQAVLNGKKYYCNDVALVLIAAAGNPISDTITARYHITPRELEVLILIAQGMTNAAIAKKLFLATRTIDTHRQNLLAKLHVKNTAGLVRIAIQWNLLPSP